MIPALFACDGRSLATHVAIVMAHFLAAQDGAATLIRACDEQGLAAHDPEALGGKVRVVRVGGSGPGTAFRLDEAIVEAHGDGRRVVLDLPASLMGEPALSNRPDVLSIVPVGPSRMDETIVRRAMSRSARSPSGFAAQWLLYCDGDQAPNRRAISRSTLDDRLPTLPVTMPNWRPAELDRIADGRPSPAALRRIGQVLDAAKAVLDGRRDDAERFSEPVEMEVRDVTGEPVRVVVESLRSLADDMEDHASGVFPDAFALAGAPVIDDWSSHLRPTRALIGTITGHPSLPPGRRSLTSEVYLTDGRSYARTFSRLYRLGRPARLTPGSSAAETN